MRADKDHTDEQALAIYQEHLDSMTRALLSGDFEPFAARLAFPHQVVTSSDTFNIATREHSRTLFDDLHASLKAEGITDVIRLAQEAVFVTPDEIVGTHVSHKMRHGERIMAPYHNRMRFVRTQEGNWVETHSSNAIINKAGKFCIVTETPDNMPAPELHIHSERKPK